TGLLIDRDAMRPVGRRDGDVAGEASRATFELCKSDGDERTALGDLIQIRDTFGLREIVLEQPGLADELRRRIVGIERLVSVHQDMPLQMEVFERRQR